MPLTLAALATAVWGWPFLSPQSLFWDDWLQLKGDPLAIYADLGYFWVGHAMVALMVAGPWAVKAVALASTIATTLGVFAISGRGTDLQDRERWLLAAFTVVLPLNLAHGSVGVLALYTTCVGLFFVAWWILVAGSTDLRPPHWRVLLATVMFFASFTTASLLVFVAVPVLHFFMLFRDRAKPLWRESVRFLGKYWYLAAAPVGFWVLRELWLTPAVAYANYNELHVSTSATSPLALGVALCAVSLVAAIAGVAVIATSWSPFGIGPKRVALLFVGGVTALWAAYIAWTMGAISPAGTVVVVTVSAASLVLIVAAFWCRPTSQSAAPLALAGIVLVAIAYIPYLLVQKQATFENWESRHQLLLPFGIAAIAVSAFMLLPEMVGRRSSAITAGALVVVMSVVAAAAPVALALDWRKQVQIIALLRENPQLATVSTVEFADESTSWNFEDRRYRFYEYTALLRAAFGGESRFGGEADDVASALSGELEPLHVNAHMYGVSDWRNDGSATRVTISRLEGASSWGLFFGKTSLNLQIDSVP